MLTEPPAAPTADIMIAMMAMPVTAPAMPAAAAAVAVRRGLRRLLASPRPMAGSAAMISKGAGTGMTNEPMALNKPSALFTSRRSCRPLPYTVHRSK
jgi:tRNA U34 5-methylaminomethyl-2-thiouridine-forming methyltransferase MnmC